MSFYGAVVDWTSPEIGIARNQRQIMFCAVRDILYRKYLPIAILHPPFQIIYIDKSFLVRVWARFISLILCRVPYYQCTNQYGEQRQ